MDPERLAQDIRAAFEAKKRLLSRDPEGERRRWAKVLEQTEHRRAKLQRAYMADAISLADLKARNAELEQAELIARGELERCGRGAQEIVELEKLQENVRRVALSLGEQGVLKAMALDALRHSGRCNPALLDDALARTPEERGALYKRLGLRVFTYPDGTTEIVLGNLLGAQEVRTTEPPSRPQCLPPPLL